MIGQDWDCCDVCDVGFIPKGIDLIRKKNKPNPYLHRCHPLPQAKSQTI